MQGKRRGERRRRRRRVGKHLTFRLQQRVFNPQRGIMRNVWIIFTLGLVLFLAEETVSFWVFWESKLKLLGIELGCEGGRGRRLGST